MFKTIVVGTDGSERAGTAVNEALNLAKMSGATLHLVHVMRMISMATAGYGDPTAVATANAEMREHGESLSARLLAESERHGVSAEVHNVEGDAADMLLKVAELVHADLVVIGNKGMSGVKRLVLGSVPNKISHHCPCSLLIVNTDTE